MAKVPSEAATPKAGLFSLRGLKRHGRDAAAALTGATASVPDGMAASVIVGVSPIHGLYASALGPIIGGLTTRTPLMIISTTGAASLAASDAVAPWQGDERVAALLLVTLMAGLMLLVAAATGMARLTSFVSHSVMTGFMSGVAVLVILGQLGTLVGVDTEGGNSIAKAIDLLSKMAEFDPATMGVAAVSFAILAIAIRYHQPAAGPLLAVIVPSVAVALLGTDGIEKVKDVGSIPSGVPSPALPDLGFFTAETITAAAAIAAIVLVQTAGVSQALPGASPAGVQKQDLMAVGLANTGSALFQGQVVGGSMGQSSLNVQSGARTRWAAILCGVYVLIIVLALGPLVEKVAMASLAAILVTAALGAIDLTAASSVWQAGWNSRMPIVATFVLTLFLPIQFAVLAGAVLSALLYLSSSSTDVHLAALTRLPSGEMDEEDPPAKLESDSVLVLQVYGSLFYAGARTLARRLPEVGNAVRPVVILRLRGKTHLGATVIEVLCSYSRSLQSRGGRLYIAGIGPQMRRQLLNGNKLQLAGVKLYDASPRVGDSVARSFSDARTWLVRTRKAS